LPQPSPVPYGLVRVIRTAWLAFAFGLSAGALACGASSYEGSVYRDPETAFEVPPPPQGWTSLDVEGDNDLAWASDGLAAVIQVNASCDPSLDIPLRNLTQQLLIGFTDREVLEEATVPMDEREALRTHLYAKLDGVRRELLLYVMKKDGCVYDFSLVAPPGSSFSSARDAYERVIGGFRARPR
jgi:hypothetical protein